MNYTELFNTIQTYTENQFPDTYLASGSAVSSTTQINTFITQVFGFLLFGGRNH